MLVKDDFYEDISLIEHVLNVGSYSGISNVIIYKIPMHRKASYTDATDKFNNQRQCSQEVKARFYRR